jgi:hypothetical protein
MDGAVFQGDPTDHATLKRDAAACERAVAMIPRVPVAVDAGSSRLFLVARLLDRAATLSFIGLGDTATALREVQLANVYFRVAAGLPKQTADFHSAALANVQLTNLQLETLRGDIAAGRRFHAQRIAARATKRTLSELARRRSARS